MTTIYSHICNAAVVGDIAKHLKNASVSMSCPSVCPFMLRVFGLFMAKAHTLYCGLVCGSHVEK
jgi:hypothetical protein